MATKGTASKKSTPMSADHKEKLERGRKNSRIVKAYVTALRENKPKRGRQRTLANIEKDLVNARAELELAIAAKDVLKELHATQHIADFERELAARSTSQEADFGKLTAEFITVAGEYSRSKGITRATWRAVGVPTSVLDDAKIK